MHTMPSGRERALSDPIYSLAGTRIPTRPLRVGLFDDFVRGTAGVESLIGGMGPVPEYFSYHDWCVDPARVDVVMATVRDHKILLEARLHALDFPEKAITDALRMKFPPTVLFLQEARSLYPHPPLSTLSSFDLVLTNDFDLLDHLPNAHWCSLIGTQLPDPSSRHICVKSELVSLLDSGKRQLDGHRIRGELAQHPTVTAFGAGTHHGPILDKWDALAPFYFNLAIESEFYHAWTTEKLIDCFISRSVPIYYGSLAMLQPLGFDTSGLIPFTDKYQMQEFLTRLPSTWTSEWEPRRKAIDHNRARALQLQTPEVLIDALIRDTFSISWG